MATTVKVDRESLRRKLPADVPPGMLSVIARTLQDDPKSYNTDWFGTMVIHGLMRWAERGVIEALDFSKEWFAFHLSRDPGLSDDEFCQTYSGSGGRVIRTGPLPFTTYCGLFGLNFACYPLFKQTGDSRARDVCVSVADAILHHTSRNHLGMVAHADRDPFAIPDACYYVAPPLMLASQLDEKNRHALRQQAIYQLRMCNSVFLDRKKNLSRTMLFNETGELGKTFWTRATGWHMWALCGVLDGLAPGDPEYKEFCTDLKALADGVSKCQDSDGCLHVLIDEPDTPKETTGTAMALRSIHEGIRRGWLPHEYDRFMEMAWKFVQSNLSDEGEIHQAYTLWAVPAEERQLATETTRAGFVVGLIILLADEMTHQSNR